MLLARLLRLLTRLRRVQPQIGRLQAFVLRRSGGRLRRSVLLAGGQPILAITTTGRRSGRLRSTTLAYVRHGDAYAVGALNLGSDQDPAWSLNLRADARAWIDVAGTRLAVAAREASGEEAELLLGAVHRTAGADPQHSPHRPASCPDVGSATSDDRDLRLAREQKRDAVAFGELVEQGIR